METAGALSLQSRTWIIKEKASSSPSTFVRFSQTSVAAKCSGNNAFENLRLKRSSRFSKSKDVTVEISSCYKNAAASAVESESSYASVDESSILKIKSQKVIPYLNGQCIYLVGMMGSGKTTVGKILSEALGYSFFDSDKLVEKAVGGTSVAQIFKDHSESFFRDNESKVLKELSSLHRLVVATGGGAVIRPVNWRYMKQGITVWLDVPLDALAKRIAAVGTDSRPLLHDDSGDPYTKAYMRLTALFEERGEAYTHADVRVCLQSMAARQGNGNASALTPTAIALEALNEIEDFFDEKESGERIA
ncbi:shikimate kinase 3, chloroplastic [Aristolochia californica]|uniref:shikimate kinase 3, chloroplastic n=1 Tax=Aristolochia californica TaxID=171875 RepID=UPI0035E05378